MKLNHLRSACVLPDGDQITDLWLDDQASRARASFELLGRRLQLVSCDEHCARAPTQNVDLFESAIVDSPRPLPPHLRASPLTYRMHCAMALKAADRDG